MADVLAGGPEARQLLAGFLSSSLLQDEDLGAQYRNATYKPQYWVGASTPGGGAWVGACSWGVPVRFMVPDRQRAKSPLSCA